MTAPTPLETYMLGLVNKERYPNSLAAQLSFEENLLDAADKHAAHLDITDLLSHTGEGGTNPGDRMKAEGYIFSGSYSWGENVGFRTGRGEAAVKLIHDALMNSPGHRANILNSRFRDIGIAVREGDYNGMPATWVVQKFAVTGATANIPPPVSPPAPPPPPDIGYPISPPSPPVAQPDPLLADIKRALAIRLMSGKPLRKVRDLTVAEKAKVEAWGAK